MSMEQRTKIEEMTRESQKKREHWADQLIQKRERALLSRIERRILEQAKEGRSRVDIRVMKLFKETLWFWERRKLATLDSEILHAIEAALATIVQKAYSSFGKEVSSYHGWVKVTLVWRDEPLKNENEKTNDSPTPQRSF